MLELLRLLSGCLRLFPRLPVTSIISSTFPSVLMSHKNTHKYSLPSKPLHLDSSGPDMKMCLAFCSQKPALKKVSKYENKFAKLQKKAAEFNFRNQLKVVKKKEFTLEDEDKEVSATRGGAVGLGTSLPAGRSRVRFPMLSLGLLLT